MRCWRRSAVPVRVWLPQRGLWLNSAGLASGEQTEQEGRQRGREDRESQARGVEANRFGSAHGQRTSGERHERLGGPICEGESGGASERRQHEALDHELPDQPAAARAERCSKGELASTSQAACKQERSKIRAGYQQHGRDHCHQESQRGTAFLDEEFVQARHEHAHALVELLFLRQHGGNRRHLCSRVIDGGSAFQPSVTLKRTRAD